VDPIVPRMNPNQGRAWLALVAIGELLPSALDAQLTADAGLTNFEYGILSMLNVAPDRSLRMSQLASAVGSAVPKLSKAVTRLENRKLVERAPCADDGRAINVRLTDSGKRLWLTATPPHVALARDQLLAALGDDQLVTLAELLEPILERLHPRGAAECGRPAASATIAS